MSLARSWSFCSREAQAPLTASPSRLRTRATPVTQSAPGRSFSFKGKHEFAYDQSALASSEVYDRHPLLWQHQEAWAQLYFSSAPSDPEAVERAVNERLLRESDGWRGFDDYCAGGGRLAGGHGQFMDGPKRLVEHVKAVLEDAGVQCSVIDGHTPKSESRVLLLGRSFVVAEAFWFEPVD